MLMELLSFFGSLPANQIALGALVTFMVFSLIRGWVVPRQVLIDRMADKDAQILQLTKERDNWHDAYTVGETARQEVVRQNTDLIEAGKTTNRLMESLRTKVEKAP